MAKSEVYKVLRDVSLPRALRKADELVDGTQLYETVGVNYAAGQYVLADHISPPVRKRVESGELDHLLEGASLDDAEAYWNATEVGTYIPEHEAEAVVLEDAGHRIVPRDQLLELRSAGAEAAAEAVAEAKKDGAADRPDLTSREWPDLASVARGDAKPSEGSSKENWVEEESLAGVQQPPGLLVGKDLEGARGGGDEGGKTAGKRSATPRGASSTKKSE